MKSGKLTLSMDAETTRLARMVARKRGKSISALVKEYIVREARGDRNVDVSPEVAQWIGVIDSPKTYRQLRDERIMDRLKKISPKAGGD
ncbi:MAG: hypothetical protein COV67_08660 [Nitrospinae bacterium CG11_big_fil_rev_8_21_14_0_20_56_8]|nr:MAG: hypothetical protein COV67_08660 [Nitrospinae bacterium CG11_big_fil_rev_8_21_14_0_20_56_8]